MWGNIVYCNKCFHLVTHCRHLRTLPNATHYKSILFSIIDVLLLILQMKSATLTIIAYSQLSKMLSK